MPTSVCIINNFCVIVKWCLHAIILYRSTLNLIPGSLFHSKVIMEFGSLFRIRLFEIISLWTNPCAIVIISNASYKEAKKCTFEEREKIFTWMKSAARRVVVWERIKLGMFCSVLEAKRRHGNRPRDRMPVPLLERQKQNSFAQRWRRFYVYIHKDIANTK